MVGAAAAVVARVATVPALSMKRAGAAVSAAAETAGRTAMLLRGALCRAGVAVPGAASGAGASACVFTTIATSTSAAAVACLSG